MTDAVKAYWSKRVLEMLEDDPELNENFDVDSNKLEEMLMLGYVLKIFKLVIVILNLSYLFGVFWLTLCEAVYDFQFDIDIEDYLNNSYGIEEEPDLFLTYFQMYKKTGYEGLIISTYFAFTSLSTVGLGDFHPRGNVERIVTGFMLLFGVAIFSYIMGNFIEILSEFKEFHQEIGDGDNLSKFFGTLKHFNG
jgi:potassium voltage-gated channel Eag-related subfamily H protein 8